MSQRSPQYCQGFLLIEAMIATVVLAVAAIGIASLLLDAHQQQESIREINTATLLARQLMEEITTKPFGAAVPVVPRSQITYANQYGGYNDSTAAMTTLGNGETVAAGDGELYTRSVTITAAPIPTGSSAPASDLKKVTVTVTTPTGQTVILNRMLTNVTWAS